MDNIPRWADTVDMRCWQHGLRGHIRNPADITNRNMVAVFGGRSERLLVVGTLCGLSWSDDGKAVVLGVCTGTQGTDVLIAGVGIPHAHVYTTPVDDVAGMDNIRMILGADGLGPHTPVAFHWAQSALGKPQAYQVPRITLDTVGRPYAYPAPLSRMRIIWGDRPGSCRLIP